MAALANLPYCGIASSNPLNISAFSMPAVLFAGCAYRSYWTSKTKSGESPPGASFIALLSSAGPLHPARHHSHRGRTKCPS
jgi:hypothetical protein